MFESLTSQMHDEVIVIIYKVSVNTLNVVLARSFDVLNLTIFSKQVFSVLVAVFTFVPMQKLFVQVSTKKL